MGRALPWHVQSSGLHLTQYKPTVPVPVTGEGFFLGKKMTGEEKEGGSRLSSTGLCMNLIFMSSGWMPSHASARLCGSWVV